MKTKKNRSAARVLAIILSIMLVLGLAPLTAFADSPPPVTILITSDVHDKTPELQSWVTAIHTGTPALNHMIFGGDFTYGTDPAGVASTCASIVNSVYSGVPVVKAKGNHDTAGTYDKGLVYNGSDYAIYALDLDSASQTISMDKIEALDTALSGIDPSKPVIVVSHYPLHYCNNNGMARTTVNAPDLVERLNKYPNAIFLWGHNHTLSDPGYGTVKKDGDTIQCASNLSPVVIHFTYVNMGSLYSSVNNAAGVLLTMTKSDGNTVLDFQYKNPAGSTSSAYTVTVDTTFIAERPTINTQPQSVSVDTGEDASVSVDAVVNDGGTLSFQWYEDENDDCTGGTEVGENSPAFSAPTLTPGAKYYYCRVSNLKDGDTASITSEAARVRVKSGEAGTVTYEYAPSIQSGSRYVIVDKSDTDTYALTTEAVTVGEAAYLTCHPVAINGSTLNADDIDESMIWELTADGDGYNAQNGGSLLHRKSGTTGGIYLNTTDEGAGYTDWEYDSAAHNLSVHSSNQNKDFFLYQTTSGGTNYFDVSETPGNSIYLYKVNVTNPIEIDSVDITGIDEPVPGAVPDTSAATASAGAVNPAAVSWSPAANPFGYDTAYTVSITVSAQFAYEFASDMVVTVNGAPADSVTLNSNGTLTVTYAFDKTAAAPIYAYEYATSAESGGTYVIVDKGTTNYALVSRVANTNYLAADAVTVNSNNLNTAEITDGMLWTFTTDGNGFNVKNGSNFLSRPSSTTQLTLKTTDDGAANTDWQYDSANHTLRLKSSSGSNSYYYLYQTGTGTYYFAVNSSDSSAKNIYLYKRVEIPPTAISSAAVTGIDVPVAGNPPDTTATVDHPDITVSAVKWTPSVTTFGHHTVYTASVRLYPQPGFAFAEGATVTINGQLAQVVRNTNGSLTASYAFGATASETISSVAVTDVVAPVAGAVPNLFASTSTTGAAVLGVLWTPMTSPFYYGTVYTANVKVSPQPGYVFADVVTATVNGFSEPAVRNLDGTLTIGHTFEATEFGPISSIEVTDIAAPEATKTPDTTASVTTGGVTVSAVSWEPDDNPFGFDTVYKASVTLTAEAGYVFAGGAVVTIDGEPADVTPGPGGTLIASYSFGATEAAVDAQTPNITGQPQNATVSEGGRAELAVTANVTQGSLSYQWYKNTADNNTSGTVISGADTQAYTAPTGTAGTMYYYCVVTNTDLKATGHQTAKATSQTAKVTVQPLQFTILALPSDPAYGTVSGGGTYQKGVSITLTAAPKPGHRFVCWTLNGTDVSRSLSYTFVALSSASFTAQFAAVTPVGISCNKTDASLYGGSNGSVTVTASGGDSGSYEYSLNGGTSWQGSGSFGGLAAGTYTAAVRDAGYPGNTATCPVTVGQPRHVGTVLASKIPSGANAGTAITVIPPAASRGYTVVSVTYSSSTPSVATVDAKGNVTFLAGGKATITTKIVAQTTDRKGKIKTKTTTIKKTVTVKQPVTTVSLNTTAATIARTQKLKLAAFIAPTTASNKKVAWISSNPKVASVSSAGVVTGKAGGTAVITCIARDGSGAKASCSVNVTPIYPSGIRMSKAALTVKTDKTASLRATVSPGNADFKAVAWTSSNPAVASVDAKGRVKGLSPGTAVIKAATGNGYTAACTVTVK